jgi:hypothetical protein
LFDVSRQIELCERRVLDIIDSFGREVTELGLKSYEEFKGVAERRSSNSQPKEKSLLLRYTDHVVSTDIGTCNREFPTEKALDYDNPMMGF